MEAVFTSFEKDVIEASADLPVLVDFWAEWCGPCRALGPVLEELAADAGGAWRLVKVNVDENQEAAQAYQVQGIPACKLFHQGEMIGEFTGALPKPQVKQWLQDNLPSADKDAVSQVDGLIEAGQVEQARSILESLNQSDPDQVDFAVRLARLTFGRDPVKAAALVESIEVGDPAFEEADAIRALGQLAVLTEPSGSGDGWRLYVEGNVALAKGDYGAALDRWIEAIAGGHREIDDDGPRKACIALFKLLGEEHEITRSRRRAFSSALF
jgi:putative thioredoxin